MSGDLRDEEVVRTLQSSLERELSELIALHEVHADDIQEAFSPGVINLLRKLSEEETFLQHPSSEESTSSDEIQSEIPCDYWKTTRMTFKFLCDEFMPAPKDQQMGTFQAFLDQVRGTASRIRLPGGASLSPDKNATLKQCVTAVKTMKEVLGSKFASLQKYVKMQMEYGRAESRHFGGTSSNVQRSQQEVLSGIHPSDAHETASSVRNESIFRYSGAGNKDVSRVIQENPASTRSSGDMHGLSRTGVIVTNVIKTIQEIPGHSGSDAEVNQRDNKPSIPKRNPLKRQSHVVEED